MIQLFDLQRQHKSLELEISMAVQDVLESGHYILGDTVERFEGHVAAYLGIDHAVGVANGTDAITLALSALGIRQGDEVIVPAFTFWGTVGAVLKAGAKPVLVDVEPDTLCIDPIEVQKAITKKTRAIIAVDLYGLRANIGKLYDLSQSYTIPVIEDAAQAFGSTWDNAQCGNYVKAACFSFFPTKPLGGAGDGGMVVTNDPEIAEHVMMLRTHGWKEKYNPEIAGFNSRLDTLQAAVLDQKLPYLSDWQRRRSVITKMYSDAFSPLSVGGRLHLPVSVPGHAWHLYTMQVQDRDRAKKKLEDCGVSCGVYYPLPIHHTKIGQKLFKDHYPVAEKAAKQVLSIPCFAEMTVDEIEWVIVSVCGI